MVKAMRGVSQEIIMDVHLCVERPSRYVKSLADAGANSIIFQFEAMRGHEDAIELAKQINEQGMIAGLSINPQTPIQDIEELINSNEFGIIDILAG